MIKDFETTPTMEWIEWLFGFHRELTSTPDPFAAYIGRDIYAEHLAWAIPTKEVVEEIAKFARYNIVEVGAGSGLWALLLSVVGKATVTAYDNGETNWPVRYYGVRMGNPTKLLRQTTFSTLFLCWPPYADQMAFDALVSYKGQRLVYIGEGRGGCTGDDDFHALLERDWDEQEPEHQVPQWRSIHDRVHFYQRKAK